MTQFFAGILAMAIVATSAFAADDIVLNATERSTLISKARVWSDPGNIASKSIISLASDRNKAYPWNAKVDCTYDETSHEELGSTGKTPKFWCLTSSENDPSGKSRRLKVKYDRYNGEVFGEVVATRLFRLLGFYADDMYPIDLNCTNCPRSPWGFMQRLDALTHFPNSNLSAHQREYVRKENRARNGRTLHFPEAVTELKASGTEIVLDSNPKSGWMWSELDQVDNRRGGASLAEIDALRILAAFVQHSDNKAEQQRLVCENGDIVVDGSGRFVDCRLPKLVVQDLGSTFGIGSASLLFLNYAGRSAEFNINAWRNKPVWEDAANCVTHIEGTYLSDMKNPKVTEAGRQLIARLLGQITDQQIHDLFEVARVSLYLRQSDDNQKVDEWVQAFKTKRRQITEHPGCPTSQK